MPALETTIAVGCLKSVGGLIPQCIPPELKDKLARPVSYMFCYSCNVKNIKDQINDLRKAHDEVEKQVDAEKTNGRNVKHEVLEWQKETAILLGKFYAKIERKLDNPDSNNCCCESAWEIGEMTDDIEKMLKQSKGFQIVAYTRDPLPVSSLYNMDSTSVLSRPQIMEKVLEALKGSGNNMIAICGLPGAGKTTMLKKIVIHNETGKQFQLITEVIDNISETPDIKMIQNSIASRIGLVFSEQDGKECRSVMLRTQLKSRLEKGKRILVVLDDIGLEIKEICKKVGIPFSLEEEHSCTILMSSRKFDGNSHFRLSCLNEVEAKRLFRDGLRNQIPNEEYYMSQEYTSMENDVLQKCEGLPSAITELSDVIKRRWRDRNEIVNQLKHRNLSEVDDVDQRSHKSVKRSYKLLKIASKKKLFLLISCLFRPGTSTAIEDFMRYGIGLSLFEKMKILEECRRRFDRWVDDMKALSLFENKDGEGCISIHNIIQESAISIASEEGYLLLEEGPQLCVNYDKYTIISTSVLGLQHLAGRELPGLQALFLKEKCSNLTMDPEDNYFTGMNKVRVLGLSEVRLSRLPSSIEHLKYLVTLSVENCDIEDASLISNLLSVRVLSLRRSKIKVFPKNNMGGLILLDLTECCFGELAVGDVVANSYPSLEGLYMCDCTFAEDTNVEVVTESLVGRLRSLEYALEIEIPSTHLPSDDGHLLLSEKLERFKIGISCKVPSSFRELYLYKQVLLFEEIDARLFFRGSLLCLLEKAECLGLVRIGNLDKVIYSLGTKLGQLKWLHISHCGEMKCVVTTAGLPTDSRVFPELEVLTLEQLGSLEVIYHGSAPHNWCSKLRELKLSNLGNLRSHALFIDHAHRLAVVEVRDCANLKHIFSAFSTNQEITASSGEVNGFHYLKKLELQRLPELNGLCFGETGMGDQTHQLFHETINLPGLEELSLSNLDNIKELWKLSPSDHAGSTTTFSELKILKLDTMPRITHVWSQGLCEGSRSFRSLQKIEIIQCANLQSLCPPTVVAALVGLGSLEITSCGNLTKVVMVETDASTTVKEFPSMRRLKLENLQSLQCFFHGSHTIEFPSLKTLILCSLPVISTFLKTPTNAGAQGASTSIANQIPFIKIIFPSLEVLELKHMNKGIEKLVEEGHAAFPKLKTLTLENMGLKFIANAILNKLQELQLLSCCSLRALPWASLLELRSLVIHGGLDGMGSMLSSTDVVQGKGLSKLEDIEIEECEHLEEIVSNALVGPSIRYGATMFSQLKHIKLRNLAKFRTFSSGSYKATFPALEKVEIYTCPSLELFSLGELHTPNLKSVQVDGKESVDRDINLNALIRNRNTANPGMSRSVPSFDESSQASGLGIEQLNGQIIAEGAHGPPKNVNNMERSEEVDQAPATSDPLDKHLTSLEGSEEHDPIPTARNPPNKHVINMENSVEDDPAPTTREPLDEGVTRIERNEEHDPASTIRDLPDERVTSMEGNKGHDPAPTTSDPPDERVTNMERNEENDPAPTTRDLVNERVTSMECNEEHDPTPTTRDPPNERVTSVEHNKNHDLNPTTRDPLDERVTSIERNEEHDLAPTTRDPPDECVTSMECGEEHNPAPTTRDPPDERVTNMERREEHDPAPTTRDPPDDRVTSMERLEEKNLAPTTRDPPDECVTSMERSEKSMTPLPPHVTHLMSI